MARVLLAVLVLLSLVALSHAFFDKLSGGGGGGGGCGGSGGGRDEADAGEAQGPSDPAVNTLFLFSGKGYAGKTFIAKRRQALLGMHTQWHLTASSYSLSKYPTVVFARQHGLDAARLQSDWDYIDEHYAALSQFTAEYKKQNPSWESDALDYLIGEVKAKLATQPLTRAAFIVDDLQFRFQLERLQRAVAPGSPDRLSGVTLVPVRVTASEAARERRGYKPRTPPAQSEVDLDAAPAGVWAHEVDNEADDVEQIMALDTFLAAKLLREVAK